MSIKGRLWCNLCVINSFFNTFLEFYLSNYEKLNYQASKFILIAFLNIDFCNATFWDYKFLISFLNTLSHLYSLLTAEKIPLEKKENILVALRLLVKTFFIGIIFSTHINISSIVTIQRFIWWNLFVLFLLRTDT